MNVDARAIASRVLSRVIGEGAWAAAALDAELARTPALEARDRALATELVYGTLRRFAWLEARALAHAREKRWPDAVTRVEIVLAAYQLFCLERVPAHAAVDAAVRAVTRARGKGLGGFTNAILRKLAKEAEGARDEAPELAAPEWLRATIARAIGDEGATAFLRASASRPPLAVRVSDPKERAAWAERLGGRASALCDTAILLPASGALEALPGFGEAWAPQEEGSQVVAHAVGARAGEVVLDACAGRGHKTAILARAVLPGGAVDVADVHPKKLDRLRAELAPLGLSVRDAHAVDLSVGKGSLSGGYDRVLVDAPCTGTGTLRRRPEILLRRKPEDVAALAAVQAKILRTALELARPGGRVVYAVCSILREEAEDVVDAVRAAAPALVSAQTRAFRLLPHVEGTDGYFVAVLERAPSA